MRRASSKRFPGTISVLARQIVVLLVFLPAISAAYSQDRIRELFEWGEYDSLLVAVDDFFDRHRDTADSGAGCRYLGYTGVASFVKGDIAGARQQFRLALECQGDLALDVQYVSPEILNLFAATKSELEQERIRAKQEDSLRIVREKERQKAEEKRQKADAAQRREEEKQRQAQAQRVSALASSVWKNTGAAAGLFSLCAAMGVFADREYTLGKVEYPKFTAAAQAGDKAQYDHYRSLIARINRNITGYSVIAGLSGCAGAYCAWRAVRAQRMKLQLQKNGDGYGVSAAIDF